MERTARDARRMPRLVVDLVAERRGGDGPVVDRLVNLSVTGATVPEYGARGLLSLDLGEGVIAAAANVVWRDIHRAPNASGLSFDPGPEVSEFVAKIVRAQLLERGEATVNEQLASLFDGLD